MESYLSLKEIASLKVSKFTRLPTLRSIATEQNWQSRPRKGRGGGLEYLVASMPAEIQAAIAKKQMAQIIHNTPALPESVKVASKKPNKKMLQLGLIPVEDALKGLDDGQKECAYARIALVSYVFHLYRVFNYDEQGNRKPKLALPLKAAAYYVAQQASDGLLPDDKQHFVAVANNRSGKKQKGLGGSTLFRWVCVYQDAKGDTPDKLRINQILALAPHKPRQKMPVTARVWLPDFQRYYNVPNKPTLKQALGAMAREYARLGRECPSYDVVQQTFQQLPVQIRERGRKTGSEYKQFLSYIERDWQVLQPNDVWVGDGHSFKATVQHPDHGRPFTPEITVILDGCTGVVVGWSVKLSESAVAVADALRHGMTHFPPPLGYYSDNGSGETADMLDKEVTGILPRLGIEHMTGIPGNPQGRGRIERLWRTTLIPLAKTYATYKGRDADSNTVRQVSQAMSSLVKAEKRGSELTPIQAAAKLALPTWKQFLADLEETIRWYNMEHEHRSLPKNPATGRHFTPMAYYQHRMKTDGMRVDMQPLSELELDFFYRPEETRKTRRGLVMLWRNSYFSADLVAFHGQEVRISYDIHCADNVIVKDMAGKIICKARFNGNRKAAFAETRMEQLAERRKQSQLRLLEMKKEVVELERKSAVPALAAPHNPDYGELLNPTPFRQPEKVPVLPKHHADDDDDMEIWDFRTIRKVG